MRYVALLSVIAFTLGEIVLLVLRRSGSARVSRDRRSLTLFWIVLPVSITLACRASWSCPAGKLPWGTALGATGDLLVIAGLVLRWYSIWRLGRWFTVDVALAPGQTLLRDGPYRYIRHPSYSGALMTLCGLGFLLDNIFSLAIIFIPPLMVFLRRIAIEEQVMSEAFGPEWTAYRAHSWKLVPGLY
ncbi:methyltransferase family protein [Brytella acorum]|uniref:Isoprenylcysteine carboxylmethyltransferase family protein n=1 Tax=Brytella acorum TaxID=2959299 RepID=A0AA35XX89_9PROT|nr:isoprenylcysteine carboxylmethyltransferase family protein [Brytella acorum]MDF3625747.1 isoprenylcysteine carboxylmethyltransferase family protein [Brytella acorum]CAI9121662.1 isoprenylcysteine carboxylmethyltransferase family protein [Brytella acorum]